MNGRPNKSKEFNGIPIKSNEKDFYSAIENHLHHVTHKEDNSNPAGLMNRGENFCFFNSVVQALYSLTGFRNHILSSPILNNNIPKIKEGILAVTKPVLRSNYLKFF